MERVDKTDKSFQFFFGAGCGSKTIIYVAAKKFWFGTVELIENLFFHIANCTTSNIIYCITCSLCNKLYIGESGRKLGDRFREHLLDVKNKGSDLSKPVARHFNLPGHSHEHMEICGIYLHLGNNETRKRKEQGLIFKLGTLAPNGINERFSFA